MTLKEQMKGYLELEKVGPGAGGWQSMVLRPPRASHGASQFMKAQPAKDMQYEPLRLRWFPAPFEKNMGRPRKLPERRPRKLVERSKIINEAPTCKSPAIHFFLAWWWFIIVVHLTL